MALPCCQHIFVLIFNKQFKKIKKIIVLINWTDYPCQLPTSYCEWKSSGAEECENND